MADLILLGEIPGTSIVITFWGWLTALLIVCAGCGIVAFLRSPSVLNKVMYVSIARSKRNYLKRLDEVAL